MCFAMKRSDGIVSVESLDMQESDKAHRHQQSGRQKNRCGKLAVPEGGLNLSITAGRVNKRPVTTAATIEHMARLRLCP
jgi:hypothetical protein